MTTNQQSDRTDAAVTLLKDLVQALQINNQLNKQIIQSNSQLNATLQQQQQQSLAVLQSLGHMEEVAESSASSMDTFHDLMDTVSDQFGKIGSVQQLLQAVRRFYDDLGDIEF